ncbi:CopCD domain protein [Natronomonas pharaonis DSM 2160]|uniref:CopCD domain protein n=1 Tax=Natronomonas pharaonis (strain ATCC 35678 / DSM 2160 / CIP 103997 / JCM 8858 / NBRC 14720 / NCIMB 2260 / Gabara) TaxID=348780 RepID=A0A1U7EYT4_NATPD|nr:copper resistance protein CopC [Natronomonas pharaonis]CAI50396.1 CopCD domain protein [Natronomonas pharaonis DSM 2160]
MTHTRTFALVVVLLVALSVVAGPVSAHANLDSSTPANGAQVESVPEAVELSFTGDGIQSAEVAVIGPDDEDISGAVSVDGTDRQQVTVPIDTAGDASGMYVVEWEVLADDGHTTSGSFFFTVGDGPADREVILDTLEDGVEAGTSWAEAVANGLLLGAIVGLFGMAVAFKTAVMPVVAGRSHAGTGTLQRRAFRLCAALVGGLVAAVLAVGLVQLRLFGPLSAETAEGFLASSLGLVWSIQLLSAVGLLAAVLFSVRRAAGTDTRPRPPLKAIAVGTFVVAAGVAATSHSATAVDGLLGGGVGLLHILGAGLWAGGLLAVWVAVSGLDQQSSMASRIRIVGRIVRRYAVLAVAGVALLLSTGLFFASWHVGGAAGLRDTQYGLLLLGKLSGVAVGLAIGGYHHFVVLPRLEGRPSLLSRLRGDPAATDGGSPAGLDRFGRTLRLEIGVLAVVVLLSGIVTATAPAAVALDAGEDTSEQIETTFDDAAGIESHIELQPTAAAADDELRLQDGQPVVVDVRFERDGDPVSATDGLELRATALDGGTNMNFDVEQHDDRYSAVITLPETGAWELRLVGDPDGVFGSVSLDVTVGGDPQSEASNEASDDDGGHDHEHDHGAGDLSEDPLQVGGVLVGIYGLLAVGYQAQALTGRAEEGDGEEG